MVFKCVKAERFLFVVNRGSFWSWGIGLPKNGNDRKTAPEINNNHLPSDGRDVWRTRWCTRECTPKIRKELVGARVHVHNINEKM